jgi:two-component system, NtrC family, response regulator AlgB
MRLLIIDDEESIRKTTATLLEGMGHQTVAVETGAEALQQIDRGRFDGALLDLKLDGESGLDLLPRMLEGSPALEVVVFTAHASIETAVEAMRRGATDYVPKPFTPEQIRAVLARISRARQLEHRVANLESRLSSDSPPPDLGTAEPAVQKVFEIALKAAATPATILLLGESGTGKTVLARAIHEQSPLRDNPFVTVSCPSLSRELLESELFGHVKGAYTGAASDTWGKAARAEGGTLFLDEIGELPLEIQPKLLRLLQEKEYERLGEAKPRRANVRVIAASNRNLEQAVKEGRCREDLFYRLNVIALALPPLRERRADLPAIAAGYLRFFAAQCGKRIESFSEAALGALLAHGWPGNLRELRNVVERSVILGTGPQIDLPDLPDHVRAAVHQSPAPRVQVGALVTLEELEKEHIRLVLDRTTTQEEAARVLGIDPATLYRRRKKLSQAEAAPPP